MYPVVYLTGAPAAGKSTVARRLSRTVRGLEVFEFGERLTAYINEQGATQHEQSDLRAKSSQISTAECVAAVDALLVDFATNQRKVGPVVIDSHPVTKEAYGYRVTPYSLADFARLAPTKIWMLYTSSSVACARIAADPKGRPLISSEEATMHTQLQASVAATYSMSLGVPLELFDADRPLDDLVEMLTRRLIDSGCERA